MQIVIVKEHFFSIGIAVLLLMTVYYGVNVIVPPPGGPEFTSGRPISPEAQKQLMDAWMRYRHTIGAIYVPLGLLILLAGSFWIRLELLATSCIFSGLLLAVLGIAWGWDSQLLRFVGSAAMLAVVLWIVYRRFGRRPAPTA